MILVFLIIYPIFELAPLEIRRRLIPSHMASYGAGRRLIRLRRTKGDLSLTGLEVGKDYAKTALMRQV